MNNYYHNKGFCIARQRVIIGVLLTLFLSYSAYAQAVEIKGKVTNEATMQPMSNASVFLSNSSFSTQTSISGSYILKSGIFGMLPQDYQLDVVPDILNEVGTKLVENKPDSLPQVKPVQLSNKWTALMDKYFKAYSLEKLFVHTDKSYYSPGDTLWFKTYLSGIDNRNGLVRSGVLYLEILSPEETLVKRISIPLILGIGWGQFILQPEIFTEGNYTLRAYTNWMQNFGEEGFFTKAIPIIAAVEDHWLADEQHSVSSLGGKKNLQFSVGVKTVGGKTIYNSSVNWSLYSDNGKVLASSKGDAAPGKLIEGRVELPAALKGDLTLSLREGTVEKLKFPFRISADEEPDVQFLPEGGYLVNGLASRLAFKAVGKGGEPITIEGEIKDGHGEVVASLICSHQGMGMINFMPKAGESYTAYIRLPSGQLIQRPVPVAMPAGSVMSVRLSRSSDVIRVFLLFSANKLHEKYTLVGTNQGKVSYTADFNVKDTQVELHIPKSAFNSGIVHLTLFDSLSRPLNERLVFLNKNDKLKIDLPETRMSFNPLDSIPMSFSVSDINGLPVRGTFSIAVTDNSRVQSDSLEENLLTRMLFQSELKGKIWAPGFYLNDTPEAQYAVDLLMLTQGWRAYDWKNVFEIPKPAYFAEPERVVRGKVVNVLGKPLIGTSVDLMTTKGEFLKLKTDSMGRFSFRGFPMRDSLEAFVQAKNGNDKIFNVGVELDKFTSPPIGTSISPYIKPWYLNTDSIRQVTEKIKAIKRAEKITGQGTLLKDVIVQTKRGIKGSKNLNGPGEADIVMDEKTVQAKIGNNLATSLLTLIPGLREGKLGRDQAYSYYIGIKKVIFVVNGIDLKRDWENNESSLDISYNESINNKLGAIDPSDIIGIEVMSSDKYTTKYGTTFRSTDDISQSLKDPRNYHYLNYAYVEITTRSGRNPNFTRVTPGSAMFKAIPYTMPITFYSPKYNTGDVSRISDLRSTIFWEPNLISDKSGQMSCKFFAGDRKGTYTVVIQGTDLNGKIGYKRFKLNIGTTANN